MPNTKTEGKKNRDFRCDTRCPFRVHHLALSLVETLLLVSRGVFCSQDLVGPQAMFAHT